MVMKGNAFVKSKDHTHAWARREEFKEQISGVKSVNLCIC